jgi:hypothetical protein
MHTIRQATDAETASHVKRYADQDGRIKFRHFVRERSAPRARNGVAHVEYSKGKTFVCGDLVAVKNGKTWEPLTASVMTTDRGTILLIDLRIKSEYLK